MSAPTPPTTGQPSTDVAWFVNQFAERVPGIDHVLLVTGDGLQLAASTGMDRALGDQLAAITSGLLALAGQGGEVLRLGASEDIKIRYPGGHLLFMRVRETAGLVVAAANGTDLRVVVHEMFQLIDSVGRALTPPPRYELTGFVSGPMVIPPGQLP